MKITLKFNIGMTFAVIAYALLLSPVLSGDDKPMLIEHFIPDSIALQIVGGLFSVASAVVALMYIVKTLWNRLFPSLCGWKEINLAESYALSLFFGVFFIQ